MAQWKRYAIIGGAIFVGLKIPAATWHGITHDVGGLLVAGRNAIVSILTGVFHL